jgi:hypothetical protein
MIMDVDDARKIRSSAELNVGDEIEAWHNGKLFHRGAVTQTVTGVELFWILDARTGTRRLIDAEALMILRPAGPSKAKTPSPSPSRAPDRTTAGSSHIPLFQAPSLAG